MTARFTTGAAIAALVAATVATAALADRGQGMQGMQGGRGAMLLEMFDAIDADKDGKLTKAELEAHRAAEFAAADTNSDGLLDAGELAAQHLARMAATAADRSAQMIARMDDNGDGSLSVDEMQQTMMDRGFSRLDADNDGAITKAEAEAAGDRFSDRRKKRHGMQGGMMEN